MFIRAITGEKTVGENFSSRETLPNSRSFFFKMAAPGGKPWVNEDYSNPLKVRDRELFWK
jgi:hypothetical protein